MSVFSKASVASAATTSLFVLLWSSGAIVSKLGLAHASPFAFLLLRSALALAGLDDAALALTRERIAIVRSERERLRVALAALPGVRRVHASDANFLLVRFIDADAAFAQLLEAGVVVRDMRAMPQLGDALRISIGTPDECRRVLAALDAAAVGAAA